MRSRCHRESAALDRQTLGGCPRGSRVHRGKTILYYIWIYQQLETGRHKYSIGLSEVRAEFSQDYAVVQIKLQPINGTIEHSEGRVPPIFY